jgi:hypothetical protein
VFFDTAGIEWKYEPEGFSKAVYLAGMPDGQEEKRINYLPDFYLPHPRTWVEVKGSDELLRAEVSRLSDILDFGSPIPDVDESYGGEGAAGLLLLGDIPAQHGHGHVFHPLIQHAKSLHLVWSYFAADTLWLAPRVSGYAQTTTEQFLNCVGVPAVRNCIEHDPSQWTCKYEFVATHRAYTKVLKAYDAARQARCEHQQVGAPANWR